MAEDKLQQQRLELKYRITDDTALRIRDFVSSYLQIDEFGSTRPNLSYPVHSLYLDSDDLRLYWDTINGTKNRIKLRLRFYDNRPEAPVYFEIKRRMNNCILKQRGGVRRDAVDWLLAGHIPEPAHLTSDNPKSLVALQRFCERMTRMRARPKAHIAYLREAWVSSNDNSIRVTLDREVQCAPEFTACLSTKTVRPVYAFRPDVILELKFTVKGQKHSLWDWGDSVDLNLNSNQNYPPWFENLARVFSLMQCGAAKYVEGIATAGEHLFQGQGYLPDQDPNLNSDRYGRELVVQDRAAGEDYD
jgi:SPX domain protein involved in polyphosphate accumulation